MTHVILRSPKPPVLRTSGEVRADGSIIAWYGSAQPIELRYTAADGSIVIGANNAITGTEVVGAYVIGHGNTAIKTANATARNMVIGSGNSTGGAQNVNMLLIGSGIVLADMPSSNAVIIANNIGFSASSVSSSVIIGRVSSAGINCVTIGRTAQGAIDGVVVGSGAIATGSGSMALGRSASAVAFTNSCALGKNALCTANNQLMIGSAGTPLTTVIASTIVSTSSSSGSLSVGGGLGVANNIFANGGTISARDGISDSAKLMADGSGGWIQFYQSGAIYSIGQRAGGGTGLDVRAGAMSAGTSLFTVNGTVLATGVVQVKYTTASTSTTSGAQTVAGGLGVAGAIFAGSGTIGHTSFSTGSSVWPAITASVPEGGAPTGDSTAILIQAGATPGSGSNRGLFVEMQAKNSTNYYTIGRTGFRTGVAWGSAALNSVFVLSTIVAGTPTDALFVDGIDLVSLFNAYHYFGSQGTEGSWRIGRNGTGLVFERRESGVWVTKQTVEA